MYAWRHENPHNKEVIFNYAWIIDAPWAHPVWNQYALFLCDLTSEEPGVDKGTIHTPGHTHEFLLYALDPAYPIVRDTPIPEVKFAPLNPPNYGYQFKADSNEAALARVQELVDGIVTLKLNPDTDYRSLWNKLLPDMYPLVKSIFDKG